MTADLLKSTLFRKSQVLCLQCQSNEKDVSCVCTDMVEALAWWWCWRWRWQWHEGDFIYTGLFGRTKKSCDKNLIAQRIIKFCAKLNSKRQVSYKSLQHSGLDCFGSSCIRRSSNFNRVSVCVCKWASEREREWMRVRCCAYVLLIHSRFNEYIYVYACVRVIR